MYKPGGGSVGGDSNPKTKNKTKTRSKTRSKTISRGKFTNKLKRQAEKADQLVQQQMARYKTHRTQLHLRHKFEGIPKLYTSNHTRRTKPARTALRGSKVRKAIHQLYPNGTQ